MIKLLIEKPTTSVRHLCEDCSHSIHVAGPGYERQFCSVLGGEFTGPLEIFRLVNECSSYNAKNSYDSVNFLPGQMKQQAHMIQRINGRLEVLSPEEYAQWDYATDNGKPFAVKRKK